MRKAQKKAAATEKVAPAAEFNVAEWAKGVRRATGGRTNFIKSLPGAVEIVRQYMELRAEYIRRGKGADVPSYSQLCRKLCQIYDTKFSQSALLTYVRTYESTLYEETKIRGS